MNAEKLAEKIEYALDLYNKDTYEEVSFSRNGTQAIARRALKGKAKLIEMLSKHPAWNADLMAVKVPVTRKTILDPTEVYSTFRRCFAYGADSMDYNDSFACSVIADWFTDAVFNGSSFVNDEALLPEVMKVRCADAWHKRRKLTRIFSSALKKFGSWTDEPGEFQQEFAKACEYITGKEETVSLFLSVNPAHFLTMSNPKESKSGDMLTSCHSLNNTEYEYNCGCSGYAADEVTMIAFTVDDADNEDLTYYRKTSRQLFMYKVGSGILVQSRMYNSGGGTRGQHEWSEGYLESVHKVISKCENSKNAWDNVEYFSNEFNFRMDTGSGFGGYPDWMYSEFHAMLSVRKDIDMEDWYTVYTAGTTGTCLVCGDEISEYAYCEDCGERNWCPWCEEHFGGRGHSVHDRCGDEITVCDHCFREDFSRCSDCGEYVPSDELCRTENDEYVCDSCAEEYHQCYDCDCLCSDAHECVDADGFTRKYCDDCFIERDYIWCEHRSLYIHKDLYTEDCEECNYCRCYDCVTQKEEE